MKNLIIINKLTNIPTFLGYTLECLKNDNIVPLHLLDFDKGSILTPFFKNMNHKTLNILYEKKTSFRTFCEMLNTKISIIEEQNFYLKNGVNVYFSSNYQKNNKFDFYFKVEDSSVNTIKSIQIKYKSLDKINTIRDLKLEENLSTYNIKPNDYPFNYLYYDISKLNYQNQEFLINEISNHSIISKYYFSGNLKFITKNYSGEDIIYYINFYNELNNFLLLN